MSDQLGFMGGNYPRKFSGVRELLAAAAKIKIKFITESWPTFMKLIDHINLGDAKDGRE
jgi:hypothetical protein